MSTVQEFEAAIPRLARQELEELNAWFDDVYEDRLELTDETKTRLDEARADIVADRYRASPPQKG